MKDLVNSTTHHLLDTLKYDQTPLKWESDFVRDKIDWDDLVVRAIVFGLAPQLRTRFLEWQIEVPPRPLAKLNITYQAQSKRNQDIYIQLDEYLAACDEYNLCPVALKGVHLAACYYADPALRPMNDIDLLFTPGELPTAEKILDDLGYAGRYKSPDMGAGVTKHTSTFRRPDQEEGRTPNPYLSAKNERTIEPHISLEESWFGLKIDITPGIRERTETAVLGGQTCRVLAPEDLLMHLCLHFCFHLIQGSPSMVQLTDLQTVVISGRIDWGKFLFRVKENRVSPYALAGLSLANKLLATPIPGFVLEELASLTPPGLRRRIEEMGLADIIHRTQQKPLTTMPQRILRGFTDRAETAKWAPDIRGRWQVWSGLFQISQTDTGQMILNRMRKRRLDN